MIRLEGIVKRFGDKTVLQGVDINVAPSEIFGLLGPSGSGKTTIINILTGQVAPDGGSYSLGAPLLRTGLMLEEDGLYKRLSCAQNLEMFATIYGVPKSRVQQALESVGLGAEGKTAVSKLSKGMRQRLALARAIIHTPDILFLDEPTGALDPATAVGIHELILGLREQGSTVFLTTHNMEEAVGLCDNVALLHQGEVVEQGSPNAICQRYDSFKTVADLGAVFIKLTGVESR